MATAIPEELVAFLESGLSMPFGTRDGQNRPAAMRAMGAFVSADRRSLFVYLPVATATRTLANLRDNGRAAVTFSRPIDLRTLQIKGQCVDIRPSTEEDLARQKVYAPAFVHSLAIIGMARETTERLAYWPSITIEIRVEELFEQTPGPAAGQKLQTAER